MQTYRNGTIAHLCDTCYRELDAGPKHDGLHFCGPTCAVAYKPPNEAHCPHCKQRVASDELLCWNCKSPLTDLSKKEGVRVANEAGTHAN